MEAERSCKRELPQESLRCGWLASPQHCLSEPQRAEDMEEDEEVEEEEEEMEAERSCKRELPQERAMSLVAQERAMCDRVTINVRIAVSRWRQARRIGQGKACV